MTSHLNNLLFKKSALVLIALALSGCLGGTAAQQLARSIMMQGADKATAAAIDANDRKEAYAANHIDIQNTEMDEYQIAFLRAGFETIKPQIEPLPQGEPAVQIEALPQQASAQPELPDNLIQVSKLVNVEVWSLLIGDEKQRLLEKERLQGSPLIPPKEEWSRWQIAVGAADNNHSSKNTEAVTFLIPPDIGKIHSGSKALVEVQTNGELSIARYALN